MELVTYDVELPRDFEGKPFVIAPIGDIQWAGKDGPTAQDTFARHVARAVSLGAWFVGFGDYIDFLSPSNRDRLRSAGLYDTALDVIDKEARDLTHELFETFLRPTKGRWAGCLEGHHFSDLRDGKTTDQLFADLLGTRFLGTAAIVRFAFHLPRSRDSKPAATCTMWCHHGRGGSGKAGTPLTKLENMAPYWGGIDIIAMGHTTKQSVAPISRIYPDWRRKATLKLEHKEIRLVNTGGFARSYVVGSKQGGVPRGLYPEAGMMAPAALGAPIIRVFPHKVKEGKRERLAIHVTAEV